MTIHVESAGADTYQVTVAGASTTQHSVTVTPEYWRKLTGGPGAGGDAHREVFRISPGTGE